MLTPSHEIGVSDLPEEYRAYAGGASLPGGFQAPTAPAAAPSPAPPGAALTMEEIERRAILDALERTGGNRTQAAEMLGIGLRTLQRKLKDYKLAGQAEPEA